MHSRYQMFKAVYFHKTVRAVEVMILESIKLADKELEFTSNKIDDFLQLSDEFVISKIISTKSNNSNMKMAKKFAEDYQNRNLLKSVYERIFNSETRLQKIHTTELRKKIAKKSLVDESEIFVDTSVTPSIPLAPSKKESQSIILIERDEKTKKAKEIPISNLPLVAAMSGFVNILRVYTTTKNRNKVEIAAQSILGGLK